MRSFSSTPTLFLRSLACQREILTFVEAEILYEAGINGYYLGLISLKFKEGNSQSLKRVPLGNGPRLNRPYGMKHT